MGSLKWINLTDEFGHQQEHETAKGNWTRVNRPPASCCIATVASWVSVAKKSLVCNMECFGIIERGYVEQGKAVVLCKNEWRDLWRISVPPGGFSWPQPALVQPCNAVGCYDI